MDIHRLGVLLSLKLTCGYFKFRPLWVVKSLTLNELIKETLWRLFSLGPALWQYDVGFPEKLYVLDQDIGLKIF